MIWSQTRNVRCLEKYISNIIWVQSNKIHPFSDRDTGFAWQLCKLFHWNSSSLCSILSKTTTKS